MTRCISAFAAIAAACTFGCGGGHGATHESYERGGARQQLGGSSSGGAGLAGTSFGGSDSTEGGSASASGYTSAPPVAPKCRDSERNLSTCDASELFEYPKIPTIDLSLPASAWASLRQHARDEQYTEATMSFEGEEIGKIGLRFKGNVSTLADCFDTNGTLTCRKLSMKFRFDKYVSGTRFYGLKRLNFNSMISDSSRLRERLAYSVYRALGVKAPRASFAIVRVNGDSLGLFSMVEQVDGRFTASNWPDDGDGTVYKEVIFSVPEPSQFPNITDEQRHAYANAIGKFRTDAYFNGRLRTNKSEADHSLLRSFSEQLAEAEPNARREVLERYMDWDYIIRYLVASDAVLNSNGLTAYYAALDYSEIAPQNYFLYQKPQDSRFWIVPWDQDGSFNLGNGYGLVPHWSEQPADCAKLYPIWHGVAHVIAPGCVPFFASAATDSDSYKRHANELLSGAFAQDKLLNQITADAAFVEPAVRNDPNGPSISSFRSSVAALKRNVDVMRRRLMALANNVRISPLHFSVDQVTDFESLSDLDVQVGPLLLTNANSEALQTINTAEPLSGSRDLKVTFTYANETEAFDQWMYFTVPMKEGTVDVRGKTGIRMRIRADRQRTIRVDLESPEQSNTSAGVRKGWDFQAQTTATVVEKQFAFADVPVWAKDQGKDPSDPLDKVLSTVTGLAFNPACRGRDQTGFLPDKTSDPGWVQIDDVEFF